MKLKVFTILSVIWGLAICSSAVACPDVSTQPTSTLSSEYFFIYIGIDNPLKLDVTGVEFDSLSVDAGTYCTVSKKDGKFLARVTLVGPTTFTVSATLNGVKKVIGKHELFAKRIPDPVAKLGTFGSGKVPIAAFKIQRGIIADVFDFPTDIKFRVTSFEFTHITHQAAPITYKTVTSGGAFTKEMLTAMAAAKAGDVVIINEIKVKGPDNQLRILPSVAYTLF